VEVYEGYVLEVYWNRWLNNWVVIHWVLIASFYAVCFIIFVRRNSSSSFSFSIFFEKNNREWKGTRLLFILNPNPSTTKFILFKFCLPTERRGKACFQSLFHLIHCSWLFVSMFSPSLAPRFLLERNYIFLKYASLCRRRGGGRVISHTLRAPTSGFVLKSSLIPPSTVHRPELYETTKMNI
jgi:hypothetical protein